MALEANLQRWSYALIYGGSSGGPVMEVAVQGDFENWLWKAILGGHPADHFQKVTMQDACRR